MKKTTNLPVPTTEESNFSLMAVGTILKSVPEVVNSIGSIVEGFNNRDIHMFEIQAKAALENSRIERDYLDKCNKWSFKSEVMHLAFQSDKISSNQIVNIAKEFVQ